MFSNLSKEQGAFAHLIVGRHFFHGGVVVCRVFAQNFFPFKKK